MLKEEKDVNLDVSAAEEGLQEAAHKHAGAHSAGAAAS